MTGARSPPSRNANGDAGDCDARRAPGWLHGPLARFFDAWAVAISGPLSDEDACP